ncbi:fimbrial protein, partial [Streptomyces griseorubiginosus]|uniref:fimbrial protein n=1 Tax=Streptomyces griseorubiginosus TaxID=67304 RepID=UPI003416AC56
MAWEWTTNQERVGQYPALPKDAGANYTFDNLILGFNIVKIGDIKAGARIPGGILGYYRDGELYPITLSVTEMNVVAASCETPDITVRMGTFTLSDIGKAQGSHSEPVAFGIKLNNCPAGLNKINYRFTRVGETAGYRNGVIRLNSSSTAKGIGIQVKHSNGQPAIIDGTTKQIYDGYDSEDEWAKLEHWVPDTSFDRFGAYFNFKVRYKQVWVWSEWAECHNLYVPQPVPPDPAKPPKPTIYPPPKPASVRESLGIGGVLLNAKVHMYTDRDIPVPGIYVVNTGIFMPTAEWVAGTTRVKVVQILNGMASDPSNLVSVSVGLSRPSIDWPPNPAMGNQTLNITGVETGDVTLRMFTEADALVAGSFTGSGATRVFTPTERWRGGTTVVSVVQTLGGVSSDPSLSVSVRVKPFKPHISLPPNPSSSTQSLEITGVANGDVTLQMSNAADGVVAGSFTGSDSKRTFTPTANWAAGITRVKVVQTVDGMHSDPSGPVSVPVKPSRPSIAEPPKPALGNQTLKISGVVSAVVSLQMYTAANAPVAGSFTGNGDTRIFYPAVNWGGGITVVTVVQSVDGIASDPSAPVPIAVKPSKLTITPPPSPAAAKEPLIITGVSSGVAVLQMSTTGGAPIEGEFAGSGTERTFVSKTGWKPGSTDVWAVQTINGMVSDPSDPVTVSVIEKPPAPVIIQPLPHTVLHADVRVQGTCIAGATITLQSAAGTSLQGDLTYDATTWSFEYLWLPGPKHIKAQQSVNGDTSEATAVLEFYIKPATPDIEPPTDPATPKQPLKITGVASGVVTLQMFTQPDRAVPGEFASNGANRLFTPVEDWSPGENTVS